MGYAIPAMPLAVNVWRFAAYPGVPTFATVGNLAVGKRELILGASTLTGVQCQLLLPALTDVRSNANAASGDIVEVPAGSGRHYQVRAVEDLGKGFPNEHRMAVISPYTVGGLWPAPLP